MKHWIRRSPGRNTSPLRYHTFRVLPFADLRSCSCTTSLMSDSSLPNPHLDANIKEIRAHSSSSFYYTSNEALIRIPLTPSLAGCSIWRRHLRKRLPLPPLAHALARPNRHSSDRLPLPTIRRLHKKNQRSSARRKYSQTPHPDHV
jgi:hypothetical protein